LSSHAHALALAAGPHLLRADEGALAELTEDVAEEAGKLGEIAKLSIYSQHADAPIVIRYKSAGAASQAVSSFNQRWFGGRQIQCEFWDGQTDFKCVVVRRGVLLLLLLLRVCPRGDVRWVRPFCARTTLTLCLRVANVLPHDCRAKDGGAVDEEERLDAFGRWLEGDEG